MRFLVRAFLFLLLLAALGAGGVYLYAGRLPAPQIQINRPDKYVGIATPLDVVVTAPGAALSKLSIVLDQGGTQTPIYTQGDTTAPAPTIEGDRILINRVIGKETVPTIKPGPARIVITAARKVVRNIRTLESTVTRDVEVRLERPRVSVVSTHHYINLGGTEMVVYRVTPGRRRVRRARRRHRVSRLSRGRRQGRGRVAHRPVAARGVLRAALEPGPQHSDAGLRPRRRRQHRARRLRLHRLSQAVQEEPDRAERQIPRAGRAGDSRRRPARSSPRGTPWPSSW